MKPLTVVEETVMLAIYRLKEGAYSVTIHQMIHEMTGKDMIIGSLFNTLQQLHQKGYLRKERSDPVRGGKKIVLYRITPEGFDVLEQTRLMHERIWKEIPRSFTLKG